MLEKSTGVCKRCNVPTRLCFMAWHPDTQIGSVIHECKECGAEIRVNIKVIE